MLEEQLNNLVAAIEPEQLRHLLPSALTDATGRFEIRDIGANRLCHLLVQGERIESTEMFAHNQPGNSMVVERDQWSKGILRTVHARDLFQAVGPSKPVVGRVIDFDTGEPIAGAIVRAYLIHGNSLHTSREREEFATRTDSDGRYRLMGLPVGAENRLVAFTIRDVPYLPAGHEVDTSQGDAVEQDFRLKRGLWAEGRVFDAATDKPFVGQIMYYHFRDRALEKEIPGLYRAYVDGRYWTNSKGEFQVPVLPIRGILGFSYSGNDLERDGIDRFPRSAGAADIEGSVDFGGSRAFPTLPNYLLPGGYERVAEVRPVAGQKTIRVDMPLFASKPVMIRVVDAEGKPVTEFEAYGANERSGWLETEGPEFQIEDLFPKEHRKVFVFHRGRNLAGGVIVHQENQNNKQPIEIKLVRSGSISGRIVDADGVPMTDVTLSADYDLTKDDTAAAWPDNPDLDVNPSNFPVDEQGRFVFDGLIPGWTYNAYAEAPRKYRGELTDIIIGSPIEGVKVEPGEKKDLGDLVIRENESDE